MSPPQMMADSVKAAIAAGNASDATTTMQQDLLAASSKVSRDRPSTTKGTSRATGTSRSRKPMAVKVREDEIASNLTPRDQYGLATEITNVALSALTEALKTKTGGLGSTVSRRPLEACSGNASPVRATAEDKAKLLQQRPSHDKDRPRSLTTEAITATAQCARLSLAFLRNINTRDIGVRDSPEWQLEKGMLALISKMIAHGLDNLAAKELVVFKRRLEVATPVRRAERAPDGDVEKGPSTARETLGSLLALPSGYDRVPVAVELAIQGQQYALRIIANSGNPKVVEQAVEYLDLDKPASPANVIMKNSENSGDTTKAAKQLSGLSQTILGVCPSVSSSADEIATNPAGSPRPNVILRLQTIALQIRKMWWTLAKHKADYIRELLDPLSKSINAFVRRSVHELSAAEMYIAVEYAVSALGPFESDALSRPTLYSIHNVLCSLAEKAGRSDQALSWTRRLSEDCVDLPGEHAKQVSILVRAANLRLSAESETAAAGRLLGKIYQAMEAKISGSSADYEALLSSLAALCSRFDGNLDLDASALVKITGSAANFALRYSKTYPEKNQRQVQEIINAALHYCSTPESLLSWVTDEGSNVLIRNGALREVAEHAATKSLISAYSISRSSISLSRVLRANLLRKVRSTSTLDQRLLLGDGNLSNSERGVLIELQLKYSAELAAKSKYHNALKKIIAEAAQTLFQSYSPSLHPVRRLRVALSIIRIQETYPELLTQDTLKRWRDIANIDSSDLGDDVGLKSYLLDLEAAISISRLFDNDRPNMEQLRSSLLVWEKIVAACSSEDDLRAHLDDPQAIVIQLKGIRSYLQVLGEFRSALVVQNLLKRVATLANCAEIDICDETLELARLFLEAGYSEQAQSLLSTTQSLLNSGKMQPLIELKYYLVVAETAIAQNCTDSGREALDAAATKRGSCPPAEVPRHQRREYEQLHARAWVLRSRFMLAIGSPHEALASAKRAVKFLNSLWMALERSDGSKMDVTTDSEDVESSEPEVETLSKGVSKLQLMPKSNQSADNSKRASSKGAAFWSLVPIIVAALIHLSDVYIHHGMFNEANYYSSRAIEITESVDSSALLSRVRSHRAGLLVLAGQVDEAELCIVQDEQIDLDEPSLAAVIRLRVQGDLRFKEGELERSIESYTKAEGMLDVLASEQYLQKLGSFDPAHSTHEDTRATHSAKSRSKAKKSRVQPPKRGAQPQAKATTKPNSTRPTKASKAVNVPEVQNATGSSNCHVLSKWACDIAIRKAFVHLRTGDECDCTSSKLHDRASGVLGTQMLQERHIEHLHLMKQAAEDLQTDVTLNILLESALSLPALVETDSKHDVLPVKAGGKNAKSKRTTNNDYEALINAAKVCLMKDQPADIQFQGTVATHLEGAMLANSSILLSAVCFVGNMPADLAAESFAIDLPRMKALKYEQNAVSIDCLDTKSDPLAWPSDYSQTSELPLSAADFQERFVDIIPKPWTAVSMTLSDDYSELYIVRYRSGQSPFILRLPFSRHKPEELDEIDDEPFDFHRGKAELQEIITRSNISCHNNAEDMLRKGAKSNWWNEREVLDTRLHELLINIENIWFGGFRSILSDHSSPENLIRRFAKRFEDILDRYLPSRQAAKGKSKRLVLDDKVLELFVGLGDDRGGEIDLDEPLADLLYFVVDMLQFNGERNAYDEIDFDSMTIDVLDALRTYHAELQSTGTDQRHLVLVLDRRLQAIPWESLPCMENVSASRVGSMLSLRECIIAMRHRTANQTTPVSEDAHCTVLRKSGTYILNPSSDLKGTEGTLKPALTSLNGLFDSSWDSLINSAPTESGFLSALEQKSILLYFGHGAGSQYIRPRAIRKAKACSEVVWLMGCSSGAITEHGDLEPSAVPLAYLLAGSCRPRTSNATENDDQANNQSASKCLAVVGTLWDVTDKDIDRFSLAVGEQWGLWSSKDPQQQHHPPAKTPRRRELMVAPATPRQPSKPPKTPKVQKTPAPIKTPARVLSRPKSKAPGDCSLVSAVARSRDVCYLRYLNGAAPVVFGVPVYLGS